MENGQMQLIKSGGKKAGKEVVKDLGEELGKERTRPEVEVASGGSRSASGHGNDKVDKDMGLTTHHNYSSPLHTSPYFQSSPPPFKFGDSCMDGAKMSPFPPAAEVPLVKNAPLAPSQELAYRNKCIQLKRRLKEIEENNDATRRRISSEKQRIQKMRLLRAILLNQIRETMDTPGRKWKQEELERMGISLADTADDATRDNEMLLDDSSDDTGDDVPEPSDRPTRNRRPNNYRESGIAPVAAPATTAYQPTNLPAIAPAYSPATQRERDHDSVLSSSFQTPQAAAAASPPVYPAVQPAAQPQPFVQDQRYQQSSPIISRGEPLPTLSRSGSISHQSSTAVSSLLAAPVRPQPPYEQFCQHMRPQLEADNYPREQIQLRIDDEWRKLSPENRHLWDERYNEQMAEYERDMDAFKREQRRREVGGAFRGS